MRLFRLVIPLLILAINLSAQKLKYIPDLYLRIELKEQGFTTNDSLDLKKIQGRLQLDIVNKRIENLNGLQYFEQVWRMNISNNLIKKLNYLPPNLTQLDCSNNKIERIEFLPKNLEWFHCPHNEINYMCRLPNTLNHLDFQDNKMTHLPVFSDKLQDINYSKNPISVDSLPVLFKQMNCTDEMQNCMPYELLKWKILNANIKNASDQIIGMKITITSGYSWGFGSQYETIEFKKAKSNLQAKQTSIRRVKGKSDSTYIVKSDYSFKVTQLEKILQEIQARKLKVQVQIKDTLRTINLENKKNGRALCGSICSDCSSYDIKYFIYTKSDTVKINYRFDSGWGLTICSPKSKDPVDIKSFLDWLYFYKIVNLTIPQHLIIKDFFNDAYISPVINWAKY